MSVKTYNKVEFANIKKISKIAIANVGKIMGAEASSSVSSMTFRIVTTAPNQAFTLPLGTSGSYAHNFTAYWGDESSSVITVYNDPNRIHTFVTPGTYDIKIEGTCEYFAFNNGGSKLLVTKMLNIVGDMGFKVFNFYGCTNLDTIIPLKAFSSLISTGINNLFRLCTNVTTIPSGMFDELSTIVTSFTYTFYQCGISSIPVDLFRYNTLVTDFTNCFNGCSSLTAIPTDLFKYNILANNFLGTFRSTGITSIPTDLFRYNTLVATFSSCFMGCSSLTAIPTDLFKYNISVTSFTYCFNGCSSLTAIPTDLFKYNILVTSFTYCFNGCSSLTAIPTDLFRYNTATYGIAFQRTFESCSSLVSLPTDLFRYNTLVTNFRYCFQYCSSLTSIPTDLFRYNTLVTNFDSCFAWDNSLATIPTDLFRYNTLVTDFTNCFSRCSSLTSIPTDLFRYNTLVTRFYATFRLTSLTSIPTDLFRYNTLVTDFGSCFSENPALQPNANIFYADGEQSTRFLNKSVTFNQCFWRESFTGIQGTAPDLWNCDFGTGTPTKSQCFYGDGNDGTSLSNYASIPSDWIT